MYSHHITTALADERRDSLLAEAESIRLAIRARKGRPTVRLKAATRRGRVRGLAVGERLRGTVLP